MKRIAKLVPQGEVADSLQAGAWEIVDEARHNVWAQTLVETLELHDSILPKKINQFRVDIEVGAIHGAVHEFGLENQPITERQRRFFWAKWAQERDPMWKALALSATYTIPARPYLRPAVDTKKRAAARITASSLGGKIAQAVVTFK